MFKAGYARLDVTPPLGSYLAGHFNERHAKGVHDTIELNAVAFTDGEQTGAIVIADFLGIMEEFATPHQKADIRGMRHPCGQYYDSIHPRPYKRASRHEAVVFFGQ